MEDLKSVLDSTPFQVWTNRAVPANDGGISLGQAALASFGQFDSVVSVGSKENASS
jgi:hydrogenase maturation protein HypF